MRAPSQHDTVEVQLCQNCLKHDAVVRIGGPTVAGLMICGVCRDDEELFIEKGWFKP